MMMVDAFVAFVVTLLVPGAGTLLVLSLPVLGTLSKRATRAALSVADAFLLAWVCGFGFDLHQQMLTAVYSSETLHGYLFVPPGLFQVSGDTGVACAYLLALPILAYAAGCLFVRHLLAGRALFGIALLLLGWRTE